MTIREIAEVIEQLAPLSLGEGYDNVGLIVGRADDQVHKALVAVDVTEQVLDEAEREGCDLIITHHPIIFQPLKRLNSSSIVERCVERAIRSGIALYACHTNLDSAHDGMSWRLASLLGIEQLRVLSSVDGVSGYGVIGELAEEVDVLEYLRDVKDKCSVGAIRHSEIIRPKVKRVAVCTGSGGSLIGDAQREGAELYITADLRYNDFYTPDGRLVVADIGHFESEYCVIDLIFDYLSKNLCTFAVRKSEFSCNPVKYLI